MGTVYRDKRSGGVIWSIRYKDVNGRLRKERTKAITKVLARRFLAMREEEVQRAKFMGLSSVSELIVRKPAISLKQFSKEFLDHAEAQCSPATVKRYRGILDINILPRFGGLSMELISVGAIQRYSDERIKEGAAPATVHQEIAVLSGIFNEAKKREIVERNPVAFVKKPRVDNKIVRFLSPEEEKKLLSFTSEPLRSAILVSIHSGLRDGELRNLTWADVRFTERQIVVRGTKSKKDRVVHMSQTLYEVLKRQIRHDIRSPYVFTNPQTAKPYDRFNNTSWRLALSEAGIKKFRWHDLRHTFASRLAQANVSLQTIAELMGHSDPSVTIRYAHLTPNNLRDAVLMLDKPAKPQKTEAQSAHRSAHAQN